MRLAGRGICFILFAIAAIVVRSFTPSSSSFSLRRYNGLVASSSSSLTVNALEKSNDDESSSSVRGQKQPSGGTVVSNKLLAETIAPFRGLRLFFYGAFASGAFAGGLITLSGVIAAMNGVRSDIDLNEAYTNLAIDFGAVIFFGIFAKLDLDKGAELNAAVDEKVRRREDNKVVTKAMRERESILRNLNINVRVSTDGVTKTAPIGVVQTSAKQHLILVAGPGRAVRDALRGAQLNKNNFAMTNILVVPYETSGREGKGVVDDDFVDRMTRPDAEKGFGSGDASSSPSYETQPYVAMPVGENWEEFINAEIDAAVAQVGDNVREEGIALVVTNNGKVLRRGIGKVPWRQMVDELEEAVTGEGKKEMSVPFLEFLEE